MHGKLAWCRVLGASDQQLEDSRPHHSINRIHSAIQHGDPEDLWVAHIGTYGHSMVKARSRLDGLPCDGGDQDAWVGEVLAVLVAVGVLECPVVVDDELSR